MPGALSRRVSRTRPFLRLYLLRASFLAVAGSAAIGCASGPSDAGPDGGLTGAADGGAPSASRDAGGSRPSADAATPGGDDDAGARNEADSADGGDPLDPGLAPPIDTNAGDYDPNEWITTAMAKVQPSDAPGAVHWAMLSAARNETESFQVHVHAPAALSGVTVTVDDFSAAHGTVVFPPASDVTVSRELYLKIPASQVSDANGRAGTVPDALVPAVDPTFHEARNAFPTDVAAGANASAWVDVFIPPSTPSGFYTSHVTVTASGKVLSRMPIRLAVWQFTLPSTASLRSDFGLSWDGACVQAYGNYDRCGAAVPSGDADEGVEYLHQLYAAFALDHRISLGGIVYAGPKSGASWAHFDSVYAPFLTGTASTARLAGAKLTSIDYTGSATDGTMIANWQSHFQTNSWLDTLVYYHCDEPASGHSCTFSDALSEETTVHSDAPGLRTLLTASIEDVRSHGLMQAVDVLTPVVDEMQPHSDASHRPAYDAFLAQSTQKRLYWYQSCDQHESCSSAGSPGPSTATWPSYMADASPMRNRVFQWLAYVFDVQGELYYLSDNCFTASCGGQTDPLQSIYAFSGNGDGTLFYPGNPRVIGGTHHVPLSSIRFELIREGMEDYELLHALDAAGQGAFARTEAQTFIHRADTFSDDPEALYAARAALGAKLHAIAIGAP
jgi:hypothetical protein